MTPIGGLKYKTGEATKVFVVFFFLIRMVNVLNSYERESLGEGPIWNYYNN